MNQTAILLEGDRTCDDRRRHFRLSVNLPMDVNFHNPAPQRFRRVTSNVSAGGIYFHGCDADGINPGQRLNFRIVIPAAAGRLSSTGVLEGKATVVRVEPLLGESVKGVKAETRVGIACSFCEPLRFG